MELVEWNDQICVVISAPGRLTLIVERLDGEPVELEYDGGVIMDVITAPAGRGRAYVAKSTARHIDPLTAAIYEHEHTTDETG